MGGLPIVRVIKSGTICFEPSEIASTLTSQIKTDMGIGGGSTVTLIETERKILVDTGFDFEWMDTPENNTENAENLSMALKSSSISPDEIDIVFITHWHRDHFGNLEIFRNVTRLASKDMIEKLKLNDFKGADDGEEIAEGVKVMLTPGHSVDHASIIVNSRLGDLNTRVAIAGDAVISYSYFHSGHIWRYNADFYDSELTLESMVRLVNNADIIIPGHGTPFMTYKPEWAKRVREEK